MQVERFEPVYIVPDGPAKLTEYGKRWMSKRMAQVDACWDSLKDICELAKLEATRWSAIQKALADSGVPVAITSGMSQYAMAKSLDNSTGKTQFTVPGTVAMTLTTGSGPTSTSTGASITEANYTTFARVTLAGSAFNAATAATPSVVTNNGAITFAACTAGTSTLTGFLLLDSATLAAGNALWYGSLTSTVISTTQTPPTVATTVMSLSMTGT